MNSAKTNKIVLILVIVGLLAWIATNERESFNAFYYGPRRDPAEYKRHPFRAS
jgi:hypothetical protein